MSRHHRVVLRSAIIERIFGVPEIFASAHMLTCLEGVDIAEMPDGITYHHLVLRRHEVLQVHGVDTESLFMGPQTHDMLGKKTTAQLRLLRVAHRMTARLCPEKRHQVRKAVLRHKQNGRALMSGSGGDHPALWRTG